MMSPRLLAAAAALAAAGCTQPACHVLGTVTRGGQPMAEATVALEPDGVSGPAANVSVKDGRFEVPTAKQLVAGKYKVRIGPAAWMADRPMPEDFPPFTTSAVLKLGDNQVSFDVPASKKK